jgi:hypothetical protein
MQGRWFALPLVAALATVVLTSLARAQDVYVTYQINNWTVAPAITGQAIKGFLAYTLPTSVTGANISLAWYQREADGSWTTWAWGTHDLCEAVLWVRAHLSDDSVFEYEPTLSGAASQAGCQARNPKPVVNGLFFDDPVQSLVENSSEPELLVTTLVDIGWEAAPDLSPLAVTNPVVCDPNAPPKDAVAALMDAETYWTELTLFGSSTASLLCSGTCPGCQRIYSGKQPAAGSSWTLRSRIGLSDGTTMCSYDRAAIQTWHESGRPESYPMCYVCNGSGQINTTMHATTYSGAGDADCHPPP